MTFFQKIKMTYFHYCSNENFYSIVTGRQIWLSSLSFSNDSLQGKLIKNIIINHAEDDNLDKITILQLENVFDFYENCIDLHGFCLSENGDLLSQWRAYSSDGCGVSIGFSNDCLEKLTKKAKQVNPFTIFNHIEYKRAVQENILKSAYNVIKKYIDEGAFESPGKDDEKKKEAWDNLSVKITTILVDGLVQFKDEAFKEEREWRIICHSSKPEDEIYDYRATNNFIYPYKAIKFDDNFLKNQIVQLVIGPKNLSKIHDIENFLSKNGFENVDIGYSNVPYR